LKKITTIFLLSLLCLNSIGLYPIFKLIQLRAKELAKNIVRQGITSDLIVFANLTENDQVKWEEEGKEFSYKGDRYDVVKVEEEEGNTLYYCYSDKKETRIANNIDDLINKQMAGNKDLSHNIVFHLMMMMAQVFIPTETYSVKPAFINDDPRITAHTFGAHYPACYIDIPIPPPWA